MLVMLLWLSLYLHWNDYNKFIISNFSPKSIRALSNSHRHIWAAVLRFGHLYRMCINLEKAFIRTMKRLIKYWWKVSFVSLVTRLYLRIRQSWSRIIFNWLKLCAFWSIWTTLRCLCHKFGIFYCRRVTKAENWLVRQQLWMQISSLASSSVNAIVNYHKSSKLQRNACLKYYTPKLIPL